jgi:dihydroflavonol-4-reductase
MAGTVLVTGGAGFVGGWCIVELLRRGYAVRTTVRSSAREAAVRKAVASAVDAGDRLSFAVADLTRDEGWDAAVSGCDYVLHVASPLGGDADPDVLIEAARDGTLRVLRAASGSGVARVVLTSSTAASTPAGRGARVVADETVWTDPTGRAVNAYRRSKTLAERAALGLHGSPQWINDADDHPSGSRVRSVARAGSDQLGPGDPAAAGGPPTRHCAPRVRRR